MTYPEAIQFLYDLRTFGAKLGLENTLKLAALAGNPQESLSFIHVAGTNGKGSTCAMLESIYREAGFRVGLFTSPHLVSFRERIQVNRQLISEAEVSRLTSRMKELTGHFSAEAMPTFFEVVTVMALTYFAEQKCDLVIWETGLGGRLDATNIVTPLASVITNIGLDHQAWLGDTLDKIAFEKAGIIKSGIPIITIAQQSAALRVIWQTATERKAPLTVVKPEEIQSVSQLPLLGAHQQINAAVAIATVHVLQEKIPVSEEALRTGLQMVQWPGRLQLVEKENQRILIDGAHNVDGAAALVDAIKTHFATEEPTLILGVLIDKDWRLICQTLAPIGRRILITPVSSARTAIPEDLLKACQEANPQAEISLCSSLHEALSKCPNDRFVVITGSLYLVGEAIEALGLSPDTNERVLNEYTPAPRT
jgi:dihydrofolate synthase/folylpolyglutamate synthase